MYQRIVANLKKGPNKRHETLEGKKYLVVPTVMLTVGVHNGSEGPFYYPPEELSKSPAVWNHKPIVVYHPTFNGQGVSACDPDVLERQKVGIILNATFDGRLISESWLDIEKLKIVDNRVLDALDRDEQVEVSTGLFKENEVCPGVWNGEAYNNIVRNIMPDHLALLPDQTGACSIKDGAGLLRNAKGDELSYADIREQLMSLLMPNPGMSSYCYICDVYQDYAIYERDGKYWKIGYAVKKGLVSLGKDAAEEVRKVTSYVMTNGKTLSDFRLLYQPVADSITQNSKEPPMATTTPATPAATPDSKKDARKALINSIFSDAQLAEADRIALESLGVSDDLFAKIFDRSKPAPVDPHGASKVLNLNQAPPAPAPAATVLTTEQYIENAPPGIREVLLNALEVQKQERASMVAAILANKANIFAEGHLNQIRLDELKGIHALVAQQGQVNNRRSYVGQGGSPVLAVNTQQQTAQEPLLLPTMDFSKKTA